MSVVGLVITIFCYVAICGSASRDKRIIGGSVTSSTKWPGIVSIRHKNIKSVLKWMNVPHKSFNEHFCGGTLISPRWVVTAASCFPDQHVQKLLNERNFSVNKIRKLFWLMRTLIQRKNLKEYYICFNEACSVKRGIANVILHPGYILAAGANKPGFDVALIKLDEPIENYLPSTIGHIDSINDYNLLNCKIAGWGVSERNYYHNSNNNFKELPVKLVDDRVCSPYIKQIELCGKSVTKAGDFCFFDTGGPMVCQSDHGINEWQLYGLISRGTSEKCGMPDNKGIYTDVTGYVGWMMSVMRKY